MEVPPSFGTRPAGRPSTADQMRAYEHMQTQRAVVDARALGRALGWDPVRAHAVLVTLHTDGLIGSTSRGFVYNPAPAPSSLRGNTIPPTVQLIDEPSLPLTIAEAEALLESDEDPETTLRPIADAVDVPADVERDLRQRVVRWLERRSRTARDALGAADIDDLVSSILE